MSSSQQTIIKSLAQRIEKLEKDRDNLRKKNLQLQREVTATHEKNRQMRTERDAAREIVTRTARGIVPQSPAHHGARRRRV